MTKTLILTFVALAITACGGPDPLPRYVQPRLASLDDEACQETPECKLLADACGDNEECRKRVEDLSDGDANLVARIIEKHGGPPITAP